MTSTISLTSEMGVKNSPPFCPSRHGELAQEVLVDFPEGVALDVHRDGVEDLQQRDQHAVVQAVIGLGQHILQVFVFLFDAPHGIVDGLAEVGAFGQFNSLAQRASAAGTCPPAPGNPACPPAVARWVRPGVPSPPAQT